MNVLGMISVWYLMLAVFCPAALADASVVREDEGQLAKLLNVPLYTWQIPTLAPKAVIVTIHGVTLHGAVFDKLAFSLAKEGYVVVSPDLRGFGRWCLGGDRFAPDGRVSFFKSRADLIRLVAQLKNVYPDLPVFLIGESMGANLALWLASACPQYLDGVIMSSPCIKRRLDLCSTLIVDTVKAVQNPEQQLKIKPYAKRYLSEDPRIVRAYLDDPLIRKTMSPYESLQSLHTAKTTLWFVERVPANIPVLVLEGTKDRMFEAKQVTPLLAKLKVNDKRVCWLVGRGHIQLETPHVRADVLNTISSWLDEHNVQTKVSNREADFISTNEASQTH